jgi:FkbM family methyltransferase
MYAEFDLDGVIKRDYVAHIDKGVLVEVGAAHPEILSFSKLYREEGWRCISIEPNPYFVDFHKKSGTEIYPYACADYVENNADFQATKWIHPNTFDNNGVIDNFPLTYESFSSIKIKQEYIDKGNFQSEIENIKVNIRTLDLILEEAQLKQEIDILIIDTEGWELEVMKGFDYNKYQPKIIILENWLHLDSYTEYMNSIGYRLNDKSEYNYIYLHPHFQPNKIK